jgi:hypothetical protein
MALDGLVKPVEYGLNPQFPVLGKKDHHDIITGCSACIGDGDCISEK